MLYVVIGLVAAYMFIPKFKEMVNGLLKKKNEKTEEAEEIEPIGEIDLTEINDDLA